MENQRVPYKEPIWIRVIQAGAFLLIILLGTIEVDRKQLSPDPFLQNTTWGITMAFGAGALAYFLSARRLRWENWTAGIGLIILLAYMAFRIFHAAL